LYASVQVQNDTKLNLTNSKYDNPYIYTQKETREVHTLLVGDEKLKDPADMAIYTYIYTHTHTHYM